MSEDFLREASLEDLAALTELEQQCFALSWGAQGLCQQLSAAHSSTAILLRSRSEPVGFVCLQHVAGEAELLRIAVLPQLRGQGYGKLLLQWAIECARRHRCQLLHLEVAEGNIAARTLYHRAGFTQVGMRLGYYTAPPDNAVLMTLHL